jgi:hypothetical protein
MENSFMHRGCAISMNAVRKQDNGEAQHVEVAVLIEEIATARVVFRENRRVESTEKESSPLWTVLAASSSRYTRAGCKVSLDTSRAVAARAVKNSPLNS